MRDTVLGRSATLFKNYSLFPIWYLPSLWPFLPVGMTSGVFDWDGCIPCGTVLFCDAGLPVLTAFNFLSFTEGTNFGFFPLADGLMEPENKHL